MPTLALEQLSDKTYFTQPVVSQNSLWEDVIARGCGISITGAKERISALHKLPLEERLREAALLLAKTSRGFIPLDKDGERMLYLGPKPFLATGQNIAKLAGAATDGQMKYYGTHFYRTLGNDFLIREGLTAANPYDWPAGSGVTFSQQDITAGVYIPTQFDNYAVAALGIFHADGFLSRDSTVLSGKQMDATFYRDVVLSTFAHAFNVVQERPYFRKKVMALYGGAKVSTVISPSIVFFSKALRTYLKTLGFTTSEEHSMSKRVPEQIRSLPREPAETFMAFYLAASASFGGLKKHEFEIMSKSSAELRDIKGIITGLGVHGTMSVSPCVHDSYRLRIGAVALKELFRRGLFNVRRDLKEGLEYALARQSYRTSV